MKRYFACLLGLLFMWIIAGDAFADHTDFDSLGLQATTTDTYILQAKDRNGVSRFYLDLNGNEYGYDSSGTVDTYRPSDRVVYITSGTQLSSWPGNSATGGQSYFQTEPGKTYIVDLYKIANSVNASGTSIFDHVNFIGVSAILSNSELYVGPAYNTTVGIVCTGATGYLDMGSGVTVVEVWTYPGTIAGLTAYGKNASYYAPAFRSGNTPQSMSGAVYNGANAYVAGGSRWVINKLGDFATFGLGGLSAVSVYPIQNKP